MIVITGRPGIGKTTVFTKVVGKIREHGFVVGGIVCPEVRSGGVRAGFKVVDLLSGSQGWLARASVDCPKELRVSKYCIDVDGVVSVGVNAILEAVSKADVVCIDEIGPMELRVGQLKDAIIYALRNSRNVFAVTHWRLDDYDVLTLLKGAVRYEVTLSNRDLLPGIITGELLGGLDIKRPEQHR